VIIEFDRRSLACKRKKSFIAQKIEDIKKVFQNACEKIEWHANKRVDKYEFDGQT